MRALRSEDQGSSKGWRGRLGAWVCLALAPLYAATCGGADPRLEDGGRGERPGTTEPDGGWSQPADAIPSTDVPLAERPDFLTRLASPADFSLLQGEGGEIKFVGQVDGSTTPAPGLAHACVFQNTERYAGHITFLRSFPELASIDFTTYLAMVMKRSGRVLWGGALKLYPTVRHPATAAPGILAYFVYSDGNEVDALTLDELAALDARLKSCVPFASEMLVLVGMDEEQAARFETQRVGLLARGVRLISPRELRPGLAAEGYSLGEGYGYLRVIGAGKRLADYGPRDVIVTEVAPTDLALVAGLVTATPQNVHSHVNLRLGEKRIPSAYVADILQSPVVSLLDGRLVRVVVSASAVQIEPAPLDAAEAFWANRRPGIPAIVADLSVTAPRSFVTLRAADAPAFGTKAANLGELHAVLPPANRVEGLGIPLSAYRDFMLLTGLQAAVEALLVDPRTTSEAGFREQQLALLARRIENATVPAELLAAIESAAQAAFGDGYATMPLRLRSSSNVEDGELLSGAGIYDSARGCFADDRDGDTAGPSACLSQDEAQALAAELARRRAELAAHPERTWLAETIDDLQSDLTKERTAARALKKVYASLWSRRAFEERAYFGVDQRAVYMGVAVNPSFVRERLDAVAVTNLVRGDATLDAGEAADPLYRVVSQIGGESVVRPVDPSAVAETLTFVRRTDGSATDLQWFTRSSLAPEPLWSNVRLTELAALLFTVHDHFATAVYAHRARLRLDLEIKLTQDDRIVIKQARPYLEPFANL
jgi:pyruvate, water dikinase